jgi:hypothetical protein
VSPTGCHQQQLRATHPNVTAVGLSGIVVFFGIKGLNIMKLKEIGIFF